MFQSVIFLPIHRIYINGLPHNPSVNFNTVNSDILIRKHYSGIIFVDNKLTHYCILSEKYHHYKHLPSSRPLPLTIQSLILEISFLRRRRIGVRQSLITEKEPGDWSEWYSLSGKTFINLSQILSWNVKLHQSYDQVYGEIHPLIWRKQFKQNYST